MSTTPPSPDAAKTESPTKRRQAERSGAARIKLVQAAMEIVGEQGLHRFTLEDVGTRAGYSRGLPAKYFHNKDGLIAALIDKVFAARALDGAIGLAAILASVAGYLEKRDLPVKRCKLVILGEALGNAAIRPRVQAANSAYAAQIAKHLRVAVAAREISSEVDVPVMAVLIMTGARGALAQWLLDPDGVDLEALRKEHMDVLTYSMVVQGD